MSLYVNADSFKEDPKASVAEASRGTSKNTAFNKMARMFDFDFACQQFSQIFLSKIIHKGIKPDSDNEYDFEKLMLGTNVNYICDWISTPQGHDFWSAFYDIQNKEPDSVNSELLLKLWEHKYDKLEHP